MNNDLKFAARYIVVFCLGFLAFMSMNVAWGQPATSTHNLKRPPGVEEILKSRPHVKKPAEAYSDKLSTIQKFALWITDQVGTFGFFMIILLWTVIWLSWNTLAPKVWRFDPFPGFVLWLFMSNVIQICLMPLIMVGQNLQGIQTQSLAESDFVVNKRSEKENELIIRHMEYIEYKFELLEKEVKGKLRIAKDAF